MKKTHPLHVAVGVINDGNGNILLSHRHKTSHQGGLWEFPGGKVERGEMAQHALARELKEELGILIKEPIPLIKINHQYCKVIITLNAFKK